MSTRLTLQAPRDRTCAVECKSELASPRGALPSAILASAWISAGDVSPLCPPVTSSPSMTGSPQSYRNGGCDGMSRATHSSFRGFLLDCAEIPTGIPRTRLGRRRGLPDYGPPLPASVIADQGAERGTRVAVSGSWRSYCVPKPLRGGGVWRYCPRSTGNWMSMTRSE